MDEAIAEKRIVGAVVLASRAGRRVYERAAGFADREGRTPTRLSTIFRWASLTKAVVATATLALVERGLISLYDPVTRFLPDFRPRLANGETPLMTARHLMTHTAGLTYRMLEPGDGPYHRANVSDGMDQPGLSIEENLQRIASVPLSRAPGSEWGYSHRNSWARSEVRRSGKIREMCMASTGVTLRNTRTPILGLDLTIKRFQAGSAMASHVHQASVMCVVLHGEMHEATDANESSYGAGHVIFKPSGVRHSNRFGPGGTAILSITMDDEVVDRLTAAGFPASDVFDSRAPSVRYLLDRLAAALRRRDGLQCDAVALQLLAAVTTDRTAATAGSPDWLWRIRAAILRDTRGTFTIDRAAREAGIEPARIMEHVRRRYGVGFAAYTHHVKIEESLMILRAKPHVTLASVAAQLGFYDQSHFTRVFKRIVGITPSAFRRSSGDPGDRRSHTNVGKDPRRRAADASTLAR